MFPASGADPAPQHAHGRTYGAETARGRLRTIGPVLSPIFAHKTGGFGVQVWLQIVLAHQGGWDEILLVLTPIALLAGLLWLANRRANAEVRRRAATEPEDD